MNHEIWTNIGIITGRIISIFQRNFGPQIVILGGDLKDAFTHIHHIIKEYLHAYPVSPYLSTVVIPSKEKVKALGATTLIPDSFDAEVYASLSPGELLVT